METPTPFQTHMYALFRCLTLDSEMYKSRTVLSTLLVFPHHPLFQFGLTYPRYTDLPVLLHKRLSFCLASGDHAPQAGVSVTVVADGLF
jgi:hypothetical protein